MYVPRRASVRAQNELEAAIQDEDPLIVFCGPRGIGKTLLLRLLRRTVEGRLLCAELSGTGHGLEDVCASALQALGAPRSDEPAEELLRLAAATRTAGQHAGLLLLIDDADDLSAETLRALLALCARSGSVQAVVVRSDAEERVDPRMTQVRLKTPMRRSEVAEYVRARLAMVVAPGRVRARFGALALWRLARASGGNPLRLQELARERLDPAEAPAKVQRAATESPDHSLALWAGGAALAALGLLVLLGALWLGTRGDPGAAPAPETAAAPAPEIGPVDSPPPQRAAPRELATTQSPAPLPGDANAAEQVDGAAGPLAAVAPEPEPVAGVSPAPVAPVVEAAVAPEPEPVAGVSPEPVAPVVEPAVAPEPEPAAGVSPAPVAPVVEAAVAPEPEPAVGVSPAPVAPLVEPAVAPEPEPVAGVSPEPTAPPAETGPVVVQRPVPAVDAPAPAAAPEPVSSPAEPAAAGPAMDVAAGRRVPSGADDPLALAGFRVVEIRGGRPRQIPGPEAGRVPVFINAVPAADIEIDGHPIGMTPIVALPVPPGERSFVATFSNGTRLERRVEVDGDEVHVLFP